MRIFIALEISSKNRLQFQAIQAKLHTLIPRSRLTDDERRFIPHITIAKFNRSIRIDKNMEVELEKIMAMPFDPIQITSIKLFESVPEHGFHKHNTLAEIKLSG